jgi:zinc transporter 1/2/3
MQEKMISFKLVAALLVLLAGVCGGFFATRLSKDRGSLASLANTFAGGVFLGAAFLHMLPDAIEKFNTFAPEVEYPLFALVAAAGFLLVLMLDKVIVSPEKGLSDDGAIYPYILMATLSIHSLITGIALGLEDHVVSAAAILLAILAHKSTAAMALAVSFTRENITGAKSRNLLLMFYTTTPIGILLGTWWASILDGPAEAKFEGIFDALAAGTFFYIAVMDLLAEEFAAKTSHWMRYLVAVLGFAIMALVAIWT